MFHFSTLDAKKMAKIDQFYKEEHVPFLGVSLDELSTYPNSITQSSKLVHLNQAQKFACDFENEIGSLLLHKR